jgi:flagellar protein FliO/FliZ
MSASLTPLLWFAGVIALIPLALWLLRRTPMGAAAASGSMRTVATLPLSGTQRVVTVEVGSGNERLWLVLGVTPHQINTLHTMVPQTATATPAASPQTAFAQMLQRMRHGGPSDHAPR